MVDGLTPSVSFALVETRYQGKPFTSKFIETMNSIRRMAYDMDQTTGPKSDKTNKPSQKSLDYLEHLDCNPDPSYTQRACENGQIMERILNYCDCFPSYDKQFEQYMEKKNLTARACNFFEHVRQGFCDYHLKYRMIPLCLQGRLQNRLKLCCTDT